MSYTVVLEIQSQDPINRLKQELDNLRSDLETDLDAEVVIVSITLN